jgi:ParB family chromosome partitioning protein
MKKSNPKKGGIEPKDEMPSFTPPSNMDASEFVATGKKTNKGSIAPHDDTHLLDMKCIPLKDIRLSPTNPRTTFDDKKTEELAESIRIKGVLQPILVRPAPHATVPYEIVFGSRRYKAAVLAKRTDIPATIRKLTDDEVIEIQITENLQREDVSPMEEAVAFKNLLMSGKLDIKGISERIGKTPHFVANRIKLCDLTEDWQKALSEERLTITSALQVCKLSVVDQEELYEQNEHEDHIHIDENDLRDFMYELKDAAFDIADPTLNQEMGPCTTCLLNTGNLMLLFPEDKNDARCTMQTCFKGKLQTTFELEIAKAIENPTVLLVDLSYNYKTQKIGDRSVLRREDVEVIKEPQELR